jgi:hypothetical protein
MARIRSIKPEFPQSESMGKVSREARLCFILLWTLADDAGRLRGNSRMLASLLYPYDADAGRLMDKWLAELDRTSCIVRYEVDGNSYIQIKAWLDHQKIDKPSASRLPVPPAEHSGTFAKVRDDSAAEGSGMDQGKDQGGDGGDEQSPPPVICLPLNDGTEYPVTQAMVDDWQATYGAVNVMQELREMRTWATANPAKRKTHRGVASFVVRWLSAEQDKGGKPKPQYGQAAPPAGRHTDTAEETARMLADQSKGTKTMPPELRQVVAQMTGRKVA